MGPEGKYYDGRGLNAGIQGVGCDNPTSTKSAVERTSIQGSLNQQEEFIGQLHAVIEQLEHRLDPVMESVPSDPRANGSGTAPPGGVMGRIEIHSQGIRFAVNRIGSILQRLQV